MVGLSCEDEIWELEERRGEGLTDARKGSSEASLFRLIVLV